MKTNRKTTLVLKVLLILFLVNGCASSNLKKRPDWAKMSKLPDDSPTIMKYPTDRFLSTIVSGTGISLAKAKEDAREKAFNCFSEIINSKVSSNFESETNYTAKSTDQAVLQDNITSVINVESKSVLVGIEEVLSWDGFDKKEKYYFACFVLDKKKSGDSAYTLAKEKYSELDEIDNRFINDSVVDEEEGERISLSVLKYILEFRILSLEAQYFGRKLDFPKDFNKLEIDSLSRVYEAGDRKEKSGDERDLEEALKLYEEAFRYRPDEIFNARMISVKKRLPCPECKFSGNCIQCKGEKGHWQTCSHCKGGLKVKVKCPACNGDGKQSCEGCNGQKKLKVKCTRCVDGKAECTSCKGKGHKIEECPKTVKCMRCSGTGQVKEETPAQTVTCPDCGGGAGKAACVKCSGAGTITKPVTYQFVACTKCNSKGELACTRCGGTGQRRLRCSKCAGKTEIICPDCKGKKTLRVMCQKCQGKGRIGICHNCNGTKTVIVPCQNCKNGEEWKVCSYCKGAGLCVVCGGIAHRK